MRSTTARPRIAVAIVIAAATISGCVQPFSELQSARMTGPRRLEVTPSLSTIAWHENGTDLAQNEFGVQAAFGVGERVDLRARYIRVQPKGSTTTLAQA